MKIYRKYCLSLIAFFSLAQFKSLSCKDLQANSKSSKSDDEVLVSINGAPAITKNSFEEYLDEFAKSDPQVEMMMSVMPNIKQQIFNNLITEKLISYWITANKKDQSVSYKQKFEKYLERVKSHINIEEFKDYLLSQIDSSDKALEEFYKNNKKKDSMLYRKPFLKIEDSVKADYVDFTDEKSAKVFYEKVKKESSKFKEFAKEINKDVKEVSMVNKTDISSPLVKAKLKDMKLSEVELVNVDKDKFVVLYAKESIKPEWADFKEIKDQLKDEFLNSKMQELFVKNIEQLKKDFKVDEENAKKFFEKDMEKHQESIKKMQEEMQKNIKASESKESKEATDRKSVV